MASKVGQGQDALEVTKRLMIPYRSKPLQTLKIELSCTRGANFHILTISTKKNEKVVQQPLKTIP